MEPTVPAYGSAESYARILTHTRPEFLEVSALAIIEVLVHDKFEADEVKLGRIKNMVAAVAMVNGSSPADPTGQLYSREADDPTPVSGARVEPHVGGMTEIGLVDETPAPSFTVHFSFGHGQTDPDTGEDLLDKYVTVIAPTYDACREAMFASRYGNRYSSEYEPSGAVWLKWKPQWTEHEVIDAMPKAGS